MKEALTLGAIPRGDGRCRFRVWAPFARQVELLILAPRERIVPLQTEAKGYHSTLAEDVGPGTRYFYRLDGGKKLPDPASRHQPEDVHGPSEVVDPHFPWTDQRWCGVPLSSYIIYELHVGTFTEEGTFDALLPHLDYLRKLGVTAIELMPVAQFPGARNWGYDGAYPFAVQTSYGGPDGLKRLVDACHRKGLAVVLDVVYNHLGPEGNYLAQYGPYFTSRYQTPWGEGINFDGPGSDEVRHYFIENALHWMTSFHIDALRLDAVHAIRDFSAYPFLEELAATVRNHSERVNRRFHLIAESDQDDPKLIRSPELGGYGLDAVWCDGFHHSLHALLTGEKDGYYQDFGEIQHLVKALREGFVYSGQYSSYRQQRHGASSALIPAEKFVVCAQNHDQIGNRALSERLPLLTDYEGLKLAAAVVLLSPYLPLLFMGEEYGETAPFTYFISHLDPDLVEAIRKGRRDEFAAFDWREEVLNPDAVETFRKAKLDHGMRNRDQHRVLLELYTKLIQLRKAIPPLLAPGKDRLEAAGFEKQRVVSLRRWDHDEQAIWLARFPESPATVRLPMPKGAWTKQLDTGEERWRGPGSRIPQSLSSDGLFEFHFSGRQFLLFTSEEPPVA
jgi:maltooligosyltrehalose trehalohydrolase